MGKKPRGKRKFGGKTFKPAPYGFRTKTDAKRYAKRLRAKKYNVRVVKASKTLRGKLKTKWVVYARKR